MKFLRFYFSIFVSICGLQCIAHPVLAKPAQFSDCVKTDDPPTCIVERVLMHGGEAPSDLLTAVVATGSVKLVPQHASVLVDGARTKFHGAEMFLKALGVNAPPDEGMQAVRDSDQAPLLAAIALLAASQNTDDPFTDATVQPLLQKANNTPAVAYMAVSLWDEILGPNDPWTSAETIRPRGLVKVWDTIIATPPTNVRMLIEMAHTAAWNGFKDKSVPLFDMAYAKAGEATNSDKARLASLLVKNLSAADQAQALLDAGGAEATDYDITSIRLDVAKARLTKTADADAINLIAITLQNSIKARSIFLEDDLLDALQKGGAVGELKTIGGVFLKHARKQQRPEEAGNWFGAASGAYRRAGLQAEALSAAREGLPVVPAAIQGRVGQRFDALSPRQAAVAANGFGTEPVRALYLAGARDEAIAFGYFTGYDRYKYARAAHEPVDPFLIIEDDKDLYFSVSLKGLISRPDRELAQRFYDGLATQLTSHGELQLDLGTLAALAGNTAKMREHFQSAASEPNLTAYFALDVAGIWRRAEIIGQRLANWN
jgi:hypothetical protein